MKIRVLAVGRKQPDWLNRGVQEYVRRLPRHLGFSVVEVAPANRSGQGDVTSIKRQEADRLNARINAGNLVIALDEGGRTVTTADLAASLERWLQDGTDVDIVIGGADGLHEDFLRGAAERWSLSGFTLPHGLARLMMCEALYRAWTMTQNHPYHRQ